MASAIKRKIVTQGRTYDENAKRYIFYPLSNLDFHATQFASPVWAPKIPRGRIVLLESLQYITQVVDEQPSNMGSMGITLGEKTMGTDAQVRFLMGNAQGSGYMESGMVEFSNLIEVDPDTVIDIENMILGPDGKNLPDNLIKFRDYLAGVKLKENFIAFEMAQGVLQTMRQSVNTAINYCKIHSGNLAKELREGQSGSMGIKSLSLTQQYYFNQIEEPLPDDRAGVNAGNQMKTVLEQLVAAVGGKQTAPAMTESDFSKDIELQELKKQLEAANAENEALKTENTDLAAAIAEVDVATTDTTSA